MIVSHHRVAPIGPAGSMSRTSSWRSCRQGWGLSRRREGQSEWLCGYGGRGGLGWVVAEGLRGCVGGGESE